MRILCTLVVLFTFTVARAQEAPPPAPYQKGKYNPTGLGEQLLKKGPDGAAAYIGCNTGSQPCGLTSHEICGPVR